MRTRERCSLRWPGAAGDPTARPDTDAANPFRGLRAFDQHDAHLFFGRERMVERLVARLGHSNGTGNLLVVVGPSGSGKSSVVKAGLIPALRAGALPRSETWFIADVTPGRYPIETLADTLESVAAEQPFDLADRLLADHRGLVDVVRDIVADDSSQLVLVVDQFEELFTHADAAEADHFIGLLTSAVTHPHCPIRVVVTVRADYSDRPLNHPEMGRLMRDSTELISPMTAGELERAIQGPAQQAGVRFEAALVAQIIADVAGEPGGLPLLQYTLTELYDARRGTVIHTAAYSELGGITAALANWADSVLSSLDETARSTARQIFLRLVTLGESAGDSRRRVRQTDLTDLGTGSAVRAVLDTFGRHRLLTFDRDPVTREPTVEIAHEALLRDWPALRQWIDNTRDDLRISAGLDRSVTEWIEANRDPAYLLQGRRLAQATEFVEDTDIAVRRVVQEFIDESMTAAAATTKRRRRVKRRITSGFAVSAVIAAVLSVLAFIGQQRARVNADLARSRELAASAISDEVLTSDPELSLLLALQSATGAEPTVETTTALHTAIAAHRNVFRYTWPEDRPYANLNGDISPSGDAMLAYSFPGDYLEVINLPDGTQRWSVEYPGADVSGYFVADGTQILLNVSGGESQPVGLYLLEASTGAELFHLPAPPCSYTLPLTSAGVAQSRFLFIELTDQDCLGPPLVHVLDVASRTTRVLGPTEAVPVSGRLFVLPAISAAGFTAIVLSRDTRPLRLATLYDTNTARVVKEIPTDFHLALSPSGSSLLTGHTNDFSVSSLETEQAFVEISTPHDMAFVNGFFPDGRVWTTGEDGVIRIWDSRSGRLEATVVAGHAVRFTALTADGNRMLGFGGGATAAVLDVSPTAGIELGGDVAPSMISSPFLRRVPVKVSSADGVVQVYGRQEAAQFVIRHADGRQLTVGGAGKDEARFSAAFIGDRRVVVGFGDELALVDGEAMQVIRRRAWEHGIAPGALLAVAPNETFIAGTSDPYGAPYLEVLEPETLDTIYHIDDAHAGIISAIAINEDSSMIATGSIDEWVRVWSAEDGSLAHAIRTPDHVVGLEFTNSDRHLLVTLETGDRFRYTLDPDELLGIARSRLTRSFTHAECTRFEIDPCPTFEDLRSVS